MKQLNFFLLLTMIACSHASAQVLDITFGMPGSYPGFGITDIAGVTGCDFDQRNDRAFAALHLADGKIILAGHTHANGRAELALVRLMPNGHYDTGMGPAGQVRINLGYLSDSCLTAALDHNERVLLGGGVRIQGQSGYVNLLARVDSNGELDPTFGAGGHIALDLPYTHEVITKIVPLPDGKILIGGNGFHTSFFGIPDSSEVFVARLLPDGQVDNSFGTEGFIFLKYAQNCSYAVLSDLLLDSEGRIVLTGGSHIPNLFELNEFTGCQYRIQVLRFLPDGMPDPSFGNNGRAELPGISGLATGLYLDDDGKILVAATSLLDYLTSQYIYLSRLLPGGATDSTFAVNGRYTGSPFLGFGVAVPESIVSINGDYYLSCTDRYNEGFFSGLLRFSSSGVRDVSFGWNGVLATYGWIPSQRPNDTTQSLFLTGYLKVAFDQNMLISKYNMGLAVSSSEEAAPRPFKVFPNPVQSGKLYLDYTGTAIEGEVTIRLSDMQGRQVFRRATTLAAGVNEVDVSGLPAGMYMLELTGRQLRGIEKVMIQR